MKFKAMNPKLRKRKIQTWFRAGRDFIYEIGVLYLSIAAQAMIASLKNRFQEE